MEKAYEAIECTNKESGAYSLYATTKCFWMVDAHTRFYPEGSKIS
jgi:hypothetical protein